MNSLNITYNRLVQRKRPTSCNQKLPGSDPDRQGLHEAFSRFYSVAPRKFGGSNTTRPKAGLRGWPAGKLPGTPTCKGRYDVTGIIANMVW